MPFSLFPLGRRSSASCSRPASLFWRQMAKEDLTDKAARCFAPFVPEFVISRLACLHFVVFLLTLACFGPFAPTRTWDDGVWLTTWCVSIVGKIISYILSISINVMCIYIYIYTMSTLEDHHWIDTDF